MKDTTPASLLDAEVWEEDVKSPMVVLAVASEVEHVLFTRLPPTFPPCTSPDTVETAMFPSWEEEARLLLCSAVRAPMAVFRAV